MQVQDYGDVVLQIFEPAQREYYDLEGFYGAAEEVCSGMFLLCICRILCLCTAAGTCRYMNVTGIQFSEKLYIIMADWLVPKFEMLMIWPVAHENCGHQTRLHDGQLHFHSLATQIIR